MKQKLSAEKQLLSANESFSDFSGTSPQCPFAHREQWPSSRICWFSLKAQLQQLGSKGKFPPISLETCVFFSPWDFSPLPFYLKIPQDRSQLAVVTPNMHKPSTSQLQPSTQNPFSHAQRQFQNKAGLTVHPLPSFLLPHQLPSLLWHPATEFLWAEVLQQQPQTGERQLKPQREGTLVTLVSSPRLSCVI